MISDLVWEEERIVVESLLGSWGAENDANQEAKGKNKLLNSLLIMFHVNGLFILCIENHINLNCHLRRGNVSDGNFESSHYEMVFFSGYYRMQGSPDSALI